MPRRKQARRTTVKDIRTILRLTHEEGLSVREITERLKIGKSSVSTYFCYELGRPAFRGLCLLALTRMRSWSGGYSAEPDDRRAV